MRPTYFQPLWVSEQDCNADRDERDRRKRKAKKAKPAQRRNGGRGMKR